jgi:hypothetical protein
VSRKHSPTPAATSSRSSMLARPPPRGESPSRRRFAAPANSRHDLARGEALLLGIRGLLRRAGHGAGKLGNVGREKNARVPAAAGRAGAGKVGEGRDAATLRVGRNAALVTRTLAVAARAALVSVVVGRICERRKSETTRSMLLVACDENRSVNRRRRRHWLWADHRRRCRACLPGLFGPRAQPALPLPASPRPRPPPSLPIHCYICLGLPLPRLVAHSRLGPSTLHYSIH